MNADEYIDSLYSKDDPILDHVLESIIANGMRNISVPPNIGKFLTLLVIISGAKEILETEH
jgi:predicted O-methyltransferase YrrM